MTAGRPVLPIGQHGVIRTKDLGGGRFESVTRLRCLDGVTRQVRARGRNKTDSVTQLQAAIDARLETGNGVDLTPKSTIRQLWKEWCAARDLNVSTCETYDSSWRLHIEPAFGSLRISELTTTRAERFLMSLKGQGRRHTARAVLRNLARLAVRRGVLPHNPMSDVELARPKKVEPKAASVMEMQDLQRDLERWVNSQNSRASTRLLLADAVELYLVTGVRTGELLALLRTDINSRDRTYLITGTVKRVPGLGLVRQPFTKGKRDRGGVFPRESMPTVNRLMMKSPTDILLPNRKGSYIEQANFRRALRDFTSEYPQWKGVTPRSFRKTVATTLDRESGAESAAIQLGHADKAVTQRHYIQPQIIAPENPTLGSFSRRQPGTRAAG